MVADNKQGDKSSEIIKPIRQDLLQRKVDRSAHRVAAERALFYLHLVRPCAYEKATRAVEREFDFTKAQLKLLFGGASFQSFIERLEAGYRQESGSSRPASQPVERIDRPWSEIRPGDVELMIRCLNVALDQEFEQPDEDLGRWYGRFAGTTLPRWGGLVRARLGVLILGLVVGFVAFGVEQVSSLLFSLRSPAFYTLATAIFIAPVAVFFLPLALGRKFGRTDKVVLRRLGESAINSLRSRRPGRNQAYFSPVSDELVAYMWLGLGLRALILLGPTVVVMLALIKSGLSVLSSPFGQPGVELSLLRPGFLEAGDTSALLTAGLLYGILVLGYLVDVWDFFDTRFVRLQALAVAALVGISVYVSDARIVAVAFTALGIWYGFSAYLRRGRKTRFWPLCATSVIYLGCATFLGVTILFARAESWSESASASSTMKPRLTEDEWPPPKAGPLVVMASSGGGTRAAIYTALTLERLHKEVPDVACGLEAISSVSGGSLANALYLADRLDNTDCGSIRGPDQLKRLQEVRRDFVEPTIVGAFDPRLSRGGHLEEAFDGAGLEGKKISALITRLRKDKTKAVPVPLFNSTNLESHAVVISPLGAEHYQNRSIRRDPKHTPYNHLRQESECPCKTRPTWVYGRDVIYGLEELLPNFDVSLASAVRASANFPFGFGLVRVETTADRPFSPEAQLNADEATDMFLTDGGVLSNSGLHTLYQLLVNRVGHFRKRGVLLLVVEASRMPSVPSWRQRNLMRSISDQPAIAQAHHRRMLSHLRDLYGEKFQVAQIALTPHEAHNVQTSWTLPRKTIAALQTDHDANWDDTLADVRIATSSLAAASSTASVSQDPDRAPISLRRPPLD